MSNRTMVRKKISKVVRDVDSLGGDILTDNARRFFDACAVALYNAIDEDPLSSIEESLVSIEEYLRKCKEEVEV